MPNLVVTCHPDGSVETLLKDKVLDTRMFGETRRIERVSEILPTDDGQMFYVRWLKGPLIGSREYDLGGCKSHMVHRTNRSVSCWEDGETIFFDSYEAGVEFEIATVNAFRLAGHSFT